MAAEKGEKLSTFRPLRATDTKTAVPGLLKTKIGHSQIFKAFSGTPKVLLPTCKEIE